MPIAHCKVAARHIGFLHGMLRPVVPCRSCRRPLRPLRLGRSVAAACRPVPQVAVTFQIHIRL